MEEMIKMVCVFCPVSLLLKPTNYGIIIERHHIEWHYHHREENVIFHGSVSHSQLVIGKNPGFESFVDVLIASFRLLV